MVLIIGGSSGSVKSMILISLIYGENCLNFPSTQSKSSGLLLTSTGAFSPHNFNLKKVNIN